MLLPGLLVLPTVPIFWPWETEAPALTEREFRCA